MQFRASLHTLGCRLNQADSARLAADLQAHGFELVPWGNPAELLVINSCAVTGVAAQKTRQVLSQARKRNPAAFIIVCGCAATDPELTRSAAVTRADLLLPNPKPNSLVPFLPNDLCHSSTIPAGMDAQVGALPEGFTLPGSGLFPERTRANLKIQDGCDFRCTYCIVPQMRGPARSRDLDDILREARELLDCGFREIVLTGVNIATYRNSGHDLADLLVKLAHLPGDFRLRLGSAEPGLVLDKVIDVMKGESKLCRFLHLPLQNGDPEILRRMARRYTVEQYAAAVNRAAAEIPGICLGTDVMVGFPGEDDAAFQRNYDFLAGLPLGLMHVFCYSPRPGTPAATWPNRPAPTVAHEREARLLELARKQAVAFAQSQLGATLQVLLETGEPANHGWSDNYLKVVLPPDAQVDVNNFHHCSITALLPDDERTVVGKLVKSPQ